MGKEERVVIFRCHRLYDKGTNGNNEKTFLLTMLAHIRFVVVIIPDVDSPFNGDVNILSIIKVRDVGKKIGTYKEVAKIRIQTRNVYRKGNN